MTGQASAFGAEAVFTGAMTSHAPVGVVGLGVMGSAMSTHLRAAGFNALIAVLQQLAGR